MLLYARSLLFNTLMYVLMLVMGVVLAPLALVSRDGAYWSIKVYTRLILWLLKVLCGLRVEVRGEVPQVEVVVASKQQSFLDILILANRLPRPKFIMKKELKWAPILGFYAMRIGCAPVDRGKKARAMNDMVSAIDSNAQADHDPGQIIIYPQGTRVPVGKVVPYKVGAAVLYRQFGVPCVPAATNAGVYWGRFEIPRRPGVAVLEFLEPIPVGVAQREFMKVMEERIETGSDALLDEIGHPSRG
ncbi:MAG: lysophospholipid acyltransferase family protein [Pseudomonadota bacterium]